MKCIVVIIPDFKYYNIILEDEFLQGNEFRTQNLIIEILELLGLSRNSFTCDIIIKTKKEK